MTGSPSSNISPASDAAKTQRRAYHSPLAWGILLTVLFAGLAFDLGTKYWSFAAVADDPVILDRDRLLADSHYNPIPHHQGIRVLPGRLLDFRLVINRGAVFGLGADQRFFFIVFTFAALAVGLVVFGRYTTSRSFMAHIGLGMILAGGIGNLYDRVVYGVVRDFLHMFPGRHLPFGWRWPGNNPEIFPWIFNIADVMLLVGMGLLMIHINRVENRRQKKQESESESSKTAQAAKSTDD
jgi:signal peptidase II